jgi:hypothetical protein
MGTRFYEKNQGKTKLNVVLLLHSIPPGQAEWACGMKTLLTSVSMLTGEVRDTVSIRQSSAIHLRSFTPLTYWHSAKL